KAGVIKNSGVTIFPAIIRLATHNSPVHLKTASCQFLSGKMDMMYITCRVFSKPFLEVHDEAAYGR
ncbi:MAG: hypothetical protein PHN75_13225, partial [Syntrophales bacterium]|nr:hypothetical protein [Syntrophales bacterium]